MSTSPKPTYIITDIEANGPHPGRHSMLAMASVAVTLPIALISQFEAVLRPLHDRQFDEGTVQWFKANPDAWQAATKNPEPAELVMPNWVNWLRQFPSPRIFVSHGLAFDGGWIDDYLGGFTDHRLIESPRHPDPLFHQGGICLRSLAAGRLGWPIEQCTHDNYPIELLGGINHSHKAMDDALGFAHLLSALMTNAKPDERS